MPPANEERDDYDDDFRGSVQPHRGVMILVFGILGVMSFSCFLLGVFGIVAWVMGKRDLELIRRGMMDREGESMTNAGYVLGIIGTILFLLQLLLVAAYLVVVVLVATK